MKNKFYNIITYIGYFVVYLLVAQVCYRISKYLSVNLFDSPRWQLYSYIGLYYPSLFGLYFFMFGELHKTIRYVIGDGYPDLIITIDKKPFWLKVKITIRGELIRIVYASSSFNIGHDFKPKEVYVNYVHMIVKLKKFIRFIKEKDFVKILIIAKEDELLRKYFPDELRKEKIKNIL